MEQYIPKSTAVAVIEKFMYDANLEADIASTGECFDEKVADAKYQLCKHIRDSIDSLEINDVDLEIEINRVWNNTSDNFPGECWREFEDIVKHFFELGLNKGQKNIWHTMDETPNYPCDILFLTDVDNMFLYRYMENGRPVDRETPYFRNILNGKCWCYCDDVKA